EQPSPQIPKHAELTNTYPTGTGSIRSARCRCTTIATAKQSLRHGKLRHDREWGWTTVDSVEVTDGNRRLPPGAALHAAWRRRAEEQRRNTSAYPPRS